jgi:hypothetical protein
MKRMPCLVVVCVAGIALLAAGCGTAVVPTRGSGMVVSETRDLRGFNAISLAGVGTARVQQGGTDSVVVEAEENLVPLITTTVENGRLRIGLKPGVSISPTRPIVYRITVARLDGADVSGSGAIEAAGTIQTDHFTARISGSGSMKIAALEVQKVAGEISGSGNLTIDRVAATQLQCDVSGSGNVRLAGRADDADLGISGSGAVHAADLQCRSADVSIAGSGDATVHTTERLTGDISGSGSLRFRGQPSVLQTNVRGSGSVSRIAG